MKFKFRKIKDGEAQDIKQKKPVNNLKQVKKRFWFPKFIFNNFLLKFISLIFAVITWFYVRDEISKVLRP